MLSAIDEYIVLDLETTGFSPSNCEIIEMAAIKVRNNEIVDTFQSFVKPKNVIPEYITGLTGISQSMVENAISAADLSLIDKYNNLDPHGKEMVDSALSIELKRMENERKKPPTVIKINDTEKHSIKLPYYDLPASAGTGEYLDEYNHFEYIYVPESENALRADYVMRVNGDSMEPKYYEGDKLLVKYTEAIDPGQIGIFVVNNERYVKKCGNGRLISLNPKCKDVIIGEFDEVRCEGKVIGKL